MERALFEKSLEVLPKSVDKIITGDNFNQFQVAYIKNIRFLHLWGIKEDLVL